MDVSRRQCFGLSRVNEANNSQDCEAACCDDDNCTVWQWCTDLGDCDTNTRCWNGNKKIVDECRHDHPGALFSFFGFLGMSKEQTGWIGRARDLDATPEDPDNSTEDENATTPSPEDPDNSTEDENATTPSPE